MDPFRLPPGQPPPAYGPPGHPPRGYPPGYPLHYGTGGDDPGWVADGQPRRTSALTLALLLGGAFVALFFFGVIFLSSAAAPRSSTRSSSSGAPPGFFFLFIGAVMLLQIGLQTWGWFARTYTVLATELVVDEGILTRHHRVLPYSRVQQIDLHRPLLAQALGLAEVRVDTAGVAGATSVKLRYIELRRAEAIRAYVLARREALRHEAAREAAARQAAAAPPPGAVAPAGTMPYAGAPPYPGLVPHPTELLRLGPGRLLLAAFTHHLVLLSVPVLAVGALWIYAIVEVASAAGNSRSSTTGVAVGFAFGVPMLFLFALFAFVSAANALITQYGWTLTAEGDDLHLRFGLFDVRNLTVPRARVQQVSVVDNPVRRALGVVSLTLHTATMVGAVEGMQGGRNQAVTKFEIPLLDRRTLDRFLIDLLGDDEWVLPPLEPRPPVARRRAMTRRTAVLLVVLGVPAVLLYPTGLALLPLAGLGVWWGAEAHRRAGLGVTDRVVALSKGVLHHRIDLVPVDRIQGCRTDAQPLQRLSGVTTLAIDVAGAAAAPDLYDVGVDRARALRRELPRRGVVQARAGRPVRHVRDVP